LRLLGCEVIAEGQPDPTPAFAKRIAETAYSFGSTVVVLAHNHPQGSANPSSEDIASTRHLTEMLKAQGISLVDHIITGNDRTISLREAGVFLGLEIS
jgi:DNA repair protein RadC